MGADITVDGNCATIFGKSQLKGGYVSSTDLRGGAAVLLAGLAAEGETVINTMNHIDRGYEGIVEKMKALGADLERRPVLE
jgi:UDP-N-acetylglucosamine 1-carboxyvinyltransferase